MACGAMTKGVTAISTELLVTVQRMGHDKTLEEVTGSQAKLYRRIEWTLPSIPTNSTMDWGD